MLIAILEDDTRRREGMQRLFGVWFPAASTQFFDNAPDMLDWLDSNLTNISMLCLDHDLGPSHVRDGERFEPGDGRDITAYLGRHAPVCPVLIHTTNTMAAPQMIESLESSGWTVDRVVPFSDLDWLEQSWLPTMLQMLRH